jgi:NitT/TauT family transport system ATP-binding protein
MTTLDADRLTEPRSDTGSGLVAAISVQDVSKVYGHAGEAVPALDRVSLDVAPGEFVCVLGASGCGKSTLLTLIAGLDKPTAGQISTSGGRTSLMFQESALFPWLNVRQNVELALKLRKIPKGHRAETVDALLDMVHLTEFENKRPHELSGGMRQRTALARALAQQAEILLMDEPFGALDAMTRDLLHEELTTLWEETGLTVLFVTHNVREAVRLGDRVILLSSRPGRVVQEFKIDIPRPRRIESHEVGDLSIVITEQLREEVRRHGTTGA